MCFVWLKCIKQCHWYSTEKPLRISIIYFITFPYLCIYKKCNCLIVDCFLFRSRTFHSYSDNTIASEGVKGVQNVHPYAAFTVFKKWGVFIGPCLLWLVLHGLIKKNLSHLVACYDKPGVLKTYSNPGLHGTPDSKISL